MRHEMRLHDAPFSMIAGGIKTIELRLYDRKRRAISVGDEIRFTNTSKPSQALACAVTALHVFPSFKELYESLPLLKCGYTKEDIAEATYTDMERYYTPEQQREYGVVGIELALL